MCKPTISFDYSETGQPIRFAWFEDIPWVCYSWWGDRIYGLPYFLFGHKYVEKSLQQRYQTWQTVVKTLKKIKAFQQGGNAQKQTNII